MPPARFPFVILEFFEICVNIFPPRSLRRGAEGVIHIQLIAASVKKLLQLADRRALVAAREHGLVRWIFRHAEAADIAPR